MEIKKMTSNMEEFIQQLKNPNMEYIKNEGIKKVKKNIILSFVDEKGGAVSYIRNLFPLSFLHSEFGKRGLVNLMTSSYPIFQSEILMKCRSLYFQRWFTEPQYEVIKRYKELQKKYKFKMVYDIDDFVWKGDDEGECIPDYNMFSVKYDYESVRKYSIEIMNMMDTIIVSTEFLGNYIKNVLGVKTKIVVVHNAIPKYFWNTEKKKPIIKNIERPKVIYTGSSTHYHNGKFLKGDWENSFCDWVIKNVKDNKIDFICMGSENKVVYDDKKRKSIRYPFFFEEIKDCDNFKHIGWLNSYQYHLPILEEKPDFGIAPLVPNYFNYSKSAIKYQEYCAAGIVGLGSTFNNDKPSPYDICQVKIPNNYSVEELDEIFWSLTEVDNYNRILQEQYKQMEDNNWWLESKKYIELLMTIF